jgi:hypothetical protein
VTPDDPWVRPANIPELYEILRRGLISEVRIFELRCENSDRLLQVLHVNRRPLAITKAGLKAGGFQVGVGNTGTRLEHRGAMQALWLDLPIEAYIGSKRPLGPKTWEVSFRRLTAECAHERVPVPADWLIQQMRAGTKKAILTDTTRMEMGARPRGK